MGKSIKLAASAIAIMITGCASMGGAPERDPATLDTGGVRSEGQEAYLVDSFVIDMEIFPERKAIAAKTTVNFEAVAPMETLELDLDGLLKVDAVTASSGAGLTFRQEPAKLYVDLPSPLEPGDRGAVIVAYGGKPLEATRAPWDGGFTWSKTPSGAPWIATSVQGEGCDVWFPCNDHPLGEPRNGADLTFTVPAGLTAVANGVLVDEETLDDGRRRFHWHTDFSTNIYGIALNIGPYALIEGVHRSVNGADIPIKFYALEEREEKARKLFEEQFAAVIDFFEATLGPYPWTKEKMGVVETPHLGMEHQTVNAYGNEYKRGEFGFDWLFQHEFAHEWFGNLMSVSNNADMWLHEGTAAYMQPVYARQVLGDAAFHAARYKSYLGIEGCVATAPRKEMAEEEVYKSERGGPGGDIYSKGAAVLHSLRYVMGEEKFWNSIRRLLYGTAKPWSLSPDEITPRFRTTDDFMAIVSDEMGAPMDWFFETYIRRGPLPVLNAERDGETLKLSWVAPDSLDFPMPIPVRIGDEIRRIEMRRGHAEIAIGDKPYQVDPFMEALRALPSRPSCEERKAEEAEEAEEDED